MAGRFEFICGGDDFLVQRAGAAAFARLAATVEDDFSREVVSGFAGTVAEVEAVVLRFRDAVRTLGLFGGRRAVWLKDVSFLADTPLGRAEGTAQQVDFLKSLLAEVDPAEVGLVVTASPVDRRRTFLKWCEQQAVFTLVAGGEGEAGAAALRAVADEEAQQAGVRLDPAAQELLLARTGGQSRLVVQEVRKLATWAGGGGEGPPPVVDEAAVEELTPNFAEGDFFAAAERFFARDLPGTLAALREHFFGGGEARPLLASLQNRARLLIQLRALGDAGFLPERGGALKAGLERAAARFAPDFAGGSAKSAYNLFSQNPWYLARLADSARRFTLRELIDIQLALVEAWDAINRAPGEAEEILRQVAAVRLAPATPPATARG